MELLLPPTVAGPLNIRESARLRGSGSLSRRRVILLSRQALKEVAGKSVVLVLHSPYSEREPHFEPKSRKNSGPGSSAGHFRAFCTATSESHHHALIASDSHWHQNMGETVVFQRTHQNWGASILQLELDAVLRHHRQRLKQIPRVDANLYSLSGII